MLLQNNWARPIAEIEELLLCMSEVSDRMELAPKAVMINEITNHLEAMSVHELIIMVKALEDKATIASSFECKNNSTNFIPRMGERVEGLNNIQQAFV